MNNLVQARSKVETLVSVQYLMPAMLAANTFALLALDRLGVIPVWIKSAASIFLAF